jgi:hypothetical protein
MRGGDLKVPKPSTPNPTLNPNTDAGLSPKRTNCLNSNQGLETLNLFGLSNKV